MNAFSLDMNKKFNRKSCMYEFGEKDVGDRGEIPIALKEIISQTD